MVRLQLALVCALWACRPASVQTPRAPTPRPALADWSPCEPPTERAECSTLTVPLDYDHPRSGSIEVAIMRIRAEQPTGRQLWYLAGGPGGAGTSLIPLLHGRYGATWLGADLYAIDHRGTGETTRLSCPAQEAPGSAGNRLLAPDEIDPCIAELRREHGDELRHLTVSNAARDLHRAIEAARDGSKVMLWGNSYGTYWAHRFLQLHGDAIDGALLEALVPPGYSYRDFDYWMNDAGMRLMQRCADDPACHDRFADDPVQLARALPARLADGHCAELDLPIPVSWFLGSLLYDHDLRGMVPLLVHMIDRCAPADVSRLQKMHAILFGDRGMLTAGDFSAPAHVHFVLSELWADDGPPAGQTVEQVSRTCLFCPADRADLDRAATRWPTYARDAHVDSIADYRGPLWMLQGGLDPGVAPEAAAAMSRHFDQAHQHFIAFPTGAHTLTGKTPAPKRDCALALLHAFVDDPAGAPVRCAEEVTPPSFVLAPDRLTEALLGEGDPWGE